MTFSGKLILCFLVAGGLAFVLISDFGNEAVPETAQIPEVTSSESRFTEPGDADTNQATEPDGVRVMPVMVSKLHRVTQVSRQQYVSGILVASRRSVLGFERTGRLEVVFVDEGQRVEKGEQLAILDQRQLRIQVLETQARLAQQVAVLEELRAGPREETIAAARAETEALTSEAELRQVTLNRMEELAQRNAVGQQTLDDARYDWKAVTARRDAATRRLEELLTGTRSEQLAAQRAAVDILKAQLEHLQIDIQDSILDAPFAGTIVRRLADEGRMLSAGQSVLELLESDHLEAHVGMPQSLVRSLQSSDYVVMTVNGHGVTGRLRSILPQVDSATRTQTAVIDVSDGVDLELADGQLVRLQVTEEIPTDGFRVPLSALSAGVKGLWTLAVVTQPDQKEGSPDSPASHRDGVVQLRAVEVLITESDFAVIRGAVREGETFVINGSHRLINGQKIRPVNVVDRKTAAQKAASQLCAGSSGQ